MEISAKTKKIIIFSLIGLGILILLLIVYLIFIRKPAAPPKPVEIPEEIEIPPEEIARPPIVRKITALSKEAIVPKPTLNKEKNGIIYYLKSNGNVFESNFDGTSTKQISSANLTNLAKIIWSPDADKVISIYSIGEQIKKIFFDYNTGKASILNPGIKHIAWSLSEDKIAYNYQSGEIGNISIANPDGSDWKIIFNTRMESLLVDWPALNKIALHQMPSSISPSHLYILNPETGELSKILSEIYGLEVLFSPKGDRLIYSQVNSTGENLNLLVLKEGEQMPKSLNVATFASKCVWSTDNISIFCAAPSAISGTLPDDYYKKIFKPVDNFWKIDTETGRKQLASPTSESASYDAVDLLLAPKQDYLFFTDANTGILYSIKLK